MPELSTLLLFAAATTGLLLVPGPSVLFVVARAFEHGRSGGLITMLGVETGAVLHLAAAVLGVSALLAASPTALFTLKLAGAAYLVSMGLATARTSHDPRRATGPTARGSNRRLFSQGLLVDALNPGTALFFLAVLPQFVDPMRGAVEAQMVALGLAFVALAMLTDGAYALLAGILATSLNRSAPARCRLRRANAAAYLGLGAAAGLSLA